MINSVLKLLLDVPLHKAKKDFDAAVKAFMKDLDKEAAEQKLRRMNGNGKLNGHHKPTRG